MDGVEEVIHTIPGHKKLHVLGSHSGTFPGFLPEIPSD